MNETEEVDRVEGLATHVELQLLGRTIADANRSNGFTQRGW
jgi:hypothetical protein